MWSWVPFNGETVGGCGDGDNDKWQASALAAHKIDSLALMLEQNNNILVTEGDFSCINNITTYTGITCFPCMV